MKVRFTETALVEIESIFAYVAAENPLAAERRQRDNEIVRSWQGPGMFMLREIRR